MNPLELPQVAQAIQLALGPIFLLAGVAGFLNLCAGRLARVVDRARSLEPRVIQARGREHQRLIREVRILDRRISVINAAILLSVMSGCMVCLVVILLFAATLFDAHFGTLIALLFIGSMLAITGGFAGFILETRLGLRTVRIRTDILEHRPDDLDTASDRL